ncbi:MAG TPA: PHB depolymerase family esterase [Planctomycetota bacterium]|nr:PHB depolymerase family esterase [Planctomycetota bacterium]
MTLTSNPFLRALALTIVALGAAVGAAAGTTVARTLDHAGLARTWRLHLPAAPRPGTALVIALHPMFTDGGAMEALSGFSAIADREGFVVAYPDGIDGTWDFGQEWYPHDDVGFIAALIDVIAAEQAIDRSLVFATGMSAGGYVSFVLAARRPDLVAAIAPVVGGMLDRTAALLPGELPVPVLMINGTQDWLVPYQGTVWPFYGRMLSAPATAGTWAASNGCTAMSTVRMPDRAWFDGCRPLLTTWSRGVGGAEVRLITIEGGGHTWPGSPLTAMFGNVCMDFSASEAIWAFFRDHARTASLAPANRG